MSQSQACYHCSSIISPGEFIEADLGGVSRSFCCPGCMAIAQTIHGEGLEVFYATQCGSSGLAMGIAANGVAAERSLFSA